VGVDGPEMARDGTVSNSRVAPRDTRGQGLGSAMGWTLGLRLLGIPIQIAFFALAARHLELPAFGWVAIANTIWQATRGLGPLGYDQVALRLVPRLLLASRGDDAVGLERFSRNRVIAITGGVALVSLVIAGLAGPLLPFERRMWLALTAVGLPAFALGGLQVAQLRARKRVRAAQLPESFGFYTLSIVLIGLALVGHACTTSIVLLSEILSAYSMCAISGWLLRSPSQARKRPLSDDVRREASASAKGFLFGQTATALGGRVPTLLAGATLGSSSAGLLEVAARIGQVGALVTWAAGIAVSPMFSEAYAKGDRDRVQQLLVLSTWATLIPSILVLIGLGVLGRAILGLFGAQFQSAWVPMLLIASAAAVNASGGLSSTLLYMTSHERPVVMFSAASLLVLLISGPPLAVALGVSGVALAVLVSSLVRDVGLSLLLVRKLSIYPPLWSSAGVQQSVTMVRSALSRLLGGKL
jgi:O-antigen/teichoic acid export membrane protein